MYLETYLEGKVIGFHETPKNEASRKGGAGFPPFSQLVIGPLGDQKLNKSNSDFVLPD